MRTYTITGPDGKDYSIDGPEGATREQVIAKIKERMSSQPAQAAPKQDPYTETSQNQSIGENLLAGAGGGLYGMYLGAKQLLGKATPEELEDHKKAMAGLRSTTAGTIGDIGGQVAGAIPAAFIPGANTYVGAGLVGAGLGALQPTTKDGERAMNVGFGATGGVVGKYLGDATGNLISKISNKITPQTANISAELQARGVDYSKLSKEVQDSLQAEATKALNAGKALDLDALSRKVDFESIGIRPMLGQLTRDPMQYQFEQNTRGVVGGAGEGISQRLNEQNQGLINAINTARNKTGTYGMDKYTAGEAISGALKSSDDAAKANVTGLYNTARNAAGINTQLNPKNFTESLNNSLDQAMVGDALPGGIRKAINQIATGDMPFTIQKAEQIRQAINAQMPSIPGRDSVAMKMVNDALQNEIDNIGTAIGGQAGEAFKSARGAASARFGALDESPALKAAVDGADPYDFVDKFVIRAKPTHLMALKMSLQEQPDLWNQARAQVIDFMKAKAVSGQSDEFAKFSQSGFKNALNSIGDARMNILFSPAEIAELKTIQRVAASIQVQPTGSAVNNSGTSQAIANLLTRMSNVPYLKELAVNPLINFKMQTQVNNALNPNLVKNAPKIPRRGSNTVIPGVIGGVAGSNLNNY